MLWGSDWPVCLLSAQYHEVVDIVENYLVHLPSTVRKNVMGLNTIKFYNLTL